MKQYDAIPEMLLKKAEEKIARLESEADFNRDTMFNLDLKIRRLKEAQTRLETHNRDLIQINNDLTKELQDLKREGMSDGW